MANLAGNIYYWKATNGINPADVQPPPPPTYQLVAQHSPVDEGVANTFTVNTTSVADGTVLNWTTGVSGTNMSFQRLNNSSGTVTINNNTGSFSITVSADNQTSPDQQQYVAYLFLGTPGMGGIELTHVDINVNDTSQTPNKIQITSYGYTNFYQQGPGGTNEFHITIDPNQKNAIIAASSWTIYELGNSNNQHSMSYVGNDGSNTLYFNVGNYQGWQTDTFWYTP